MEQYIYTGVKYSAEITEKSVLVKIRDRKIVNLLPSSAVCTVENNENIADTDERLVSFEKVGDGVFLYTAKSKLWDKVYTFECDSEGITYSVKVKGTGSVGTVEYFGGIEDAEFACGSDYYFCEWFYPCPGCSPEIPIRASSASSNRTFYELLIPPCHVYSFRTEEISTRFGLGLIAKEGEYNFIHYDYVRKSAHRRFGFALSVDFEGHTKVNGEFEFPKIRTFFGNDDMDVVRLYCDYHFAKGLCRPQNNEKRPRWWYGPIVCGWNEQGAQQIAAKDGRDQKSFATQETYMKIADMIESHNIKPTMLIIDDKWQLGYGNQIPDPKKWEDMRAFTDEMHRRGIHTLLWFRMWGGEGLPEDEKMEGEGIPYRAIRLNYGPYADPTNEKYRAHLKEILHTLLSDEEGCMNCDGFKLDYTLVMPYGKSAKSAGGQYGAELTKELYKLIYYTAKEIKPDCLINGSPCHPYFAEVCDMARVHDYPWTCRNETEQMKLRADLFRMAMPDILIDTDSVNGASPDDAMRYYRNQAKIGIPCIYQFSYDGVLELTEDDWAEIAKIFNDYSAKIDKEY